MVTNPHFVSRIIARKLSKHAVSITEMLDDEETTAGKAAFLAFANARLNVRPHVLPYWLRLRAMHVDPDGAVVKSERWSKWEPGMDDEARRDLVTMMFQASRPTMNAYDHWSKQPESAVGNNMVDLAGLKEGARILPSEIWNGTGSFADLRRARHFVGKFMLTGIADKHEEIRKEAIMAGINPEHAEASIPVLTEIFAEAVTPVMERYEKSKTKKKAGS